MAERGNKKRSFYQLIGMFPFALPFISLVSGVFSGKFGLSVLSALVLFAVSALLVAILLYLSKRNIGTELKVRKYFVLPIGGFFFGLGILSWNLFSPPSKILVNGSHQFVTARINEATTTANGERLEVEVIYFSGVKGETVPLNHPIKTLVYTGVGEFRRGEIIRFRNFLEPLRSQGEFDSGYINSLHSQGIFYTARVSVEQIEILDYKPSLRNRAADLRDRLVIFIENTTLNKDTKAFLSAILLGERSALSDKVVDDFALAGVAHFLALSGMHLGIVALILSTFILPFSVFLGRKTRYVIVFIGIWLFALLTGLSVTIVRASIMTSIFLLAMLSERKNTPLNSLLAAGFLIILFDPLALFSIGFQLSFTVCVSLIFLSEFLRGLSQRKYDKRYMLVHSEWAERHPKLVQIRLRAGFLASRMFGLCCISVIAFLASWILCAYYFNQLSLMFLPANLLAVGLVWCIFICAVIYLPLCAIGLPIPPLSRLLDWLTSLLMRWTKWVADTGGTFDSVFVQKEPVLFYFVALACLLLWILSRRGLLLWGANVSLALGILCALTIPLNLPHIGVQISSDQGEPLMYHISGKEKEQILFQRGELSRISTPAGEIVVADTERELDEGYDDVCKLLILTANTGKNAVQLIERINPEQIAYLSKGFGYADEARDSIVKAKGVEIRNLYEETVFLPCD